MTIAIGLVIHNLVVALLAPADPLASIGVRVYRLGSGGYWVDPQSLGRLARIMIIWPGINWILIISLVLIVIFWERRPLSSLGLRRPVVGDLLAALGALVAFHVIGFVGNSLGSFANPKMSPALYALPWGGTAVVAERLSLRGDHVSPIFHRAR